MLDDKYTQKVFAAGMMAGFLVCLIAITAAQSKSAVSLLWAIPVALIVVGLLYPRRRK